MKTNKEYREVYDNTSILRIFITEEKNNIITYKAFICGIMQFEGVCHHNDIYEMINYMDLYERKSVIPKISEEISPLIVFDSFPLMNILLLFKIKDARTNLSLFLEDLNHKMDENNIK